MIIGPPRLDFTSFGLRRSLAYGIAMGIAALWLTEPMLISTSSGHGSWVGITIGAIHVADNDASVAKAGNRMVGTLIAAGFALIMLNTTAIQYTAVWLPLLSLFISACHFWRHLMDGSYFYVIQVAAFTSALLVLQPGTLTPSTAGESAFELDGSAPWVASHHNLERPLAVDRLAAWNSAPDHQAS